MVDALATVRLVQIVVLAASLPLAVLAAWGFRAAPVGRAVAALPVVSLGFASSASAELLPPGTLPAQSALAFGGALGALGFAWLAVSFLQLVSGHRRVGQ